MTIPIYCDEAGFVMKVLGITRQELRARAEAELARQVSQYGEDFTMWFSCWEVIPKEMWSVATKTPKTLARVMCTCCDRVPESIDPLPSRWAGWDSMEPNNNWVWCPKWRHGRYRKVWRGRKIARLLARHAPPRPHRKFKRQKRIFVVSAIQLNLFPHPRDGRSLTT
jgi:hypothetical protein